MSLPLSKLAIVDVETTGSTARYDRIIEVGVVLIDDWQVTKTFTQVINPNRSISPFISKLTGITNTEVSDAPVFEDVADSLWGMLDNRILVAHNARFDYSFLKSEFSRLDFDYRVRQLCSVKLSRRLYPTEPRHGLDTFIERFNLQCENRHRALDDAQLVWQFFEKASEQLGREKIESVASELLRCQCLPTAITKKDLDALPRTHGVYMFLDEHNMPLYIGKSINVRERVLSHFYSDLTDTKEDAIKRKTSKIKVLTTAGELESLLKEADLVKQLQPRYNRKLRRHRQMYAMQLVENEKGYLAFNFNKHDQVTENEVKGEVCLFRNWQEAEKVIRSVVKSAQLCSHLTGLESGSGPCFGYHLQVCQGACIEKEDIESYNQRAREAFEQIAIWKWPYEEPMMVREENETTGNWAEHTFNHWCHIETKSSGESWQYELFPVNKKYAFDIDKYLILRRYLRSKL